MKKLKTILVAGVSLLTVSSCSFFDSRPDDFISSEDNYGEKTAIYANFIGIYGLLQDVVDQLVFVTELRGDLMMPTDQAPDKYWDVYRYNFDDMGANELYNPAPFYKIVMNTNDFLRNTVAYNTKYPGVIPTNIYRQMIASAVCFRSWAYLTLGKLYGGAIYYDYAFTGEIDLSKMQDKWLSLNELVPQLIFFMNNGVDRINGLRHIELDGMFGVSGLPWRRMSIAPDILLTELYLWNRNYDMAARRGINLITDKGVVGAGNQDRWSMSGFFLKNDWKKMFTTGFGDDHTNEGLTVVFWNRNQGQDNKLMKYFNTPGFYYVDSEYILKPTQAYINQFDYFGRLSTTESSNLDTRYSSTTVRQGTIQGAQRVISKFNQTFNEKYFYIYRAAELHLLIAEALVGLGDFEAADSLVNYGTRLSQPNGQLLYPFNSPAWRHSKFTRSLGPRGRVGEGNGGNRVVPRITSDQFMSARLKELHRKNEAGTEYVYREIALVGPSHPRYGEYEEYATRRRFILDSLIAVETGRELGFEGKKFFTLIRMATQLDNPDMLALQVAKKYDNEDDQFEAAQILRNKANWFINYDLKLMNNNAAE